MYRSAQIERDDEFIDNSYIIHGQRPTADISFSFRNYYTLAYVLHTTQHTLSIWPNPRCTLRIRRSLFTASFHLSLFIRRSIRCVGTHEALHVRPSILQTSCYIRQYEMSKKIRGKNFTHAHSSKYEAMCAWFALNVYGFDYDFVFAHQTRTPIPTYAAAARSRPICNLFRWPNEWTKTDLSIQIHLHAVTNNKKVRTCNIRQYIQPTDRPTEDQCASPYTQLS